MSDALFEGLRPHRGQTLSRKPPFILCRHDAAGPFTLALFVRGLFFEAPLSDRLPVCCSVAGSYQHGS